MLKDLDHYILVALVDALNELVSSEEDSDTASVTVAGAANYIAEHFEVRLPEELLSKSLTRILVHDQKSDVFKIRKSAFASDRYLVTFYPSERIYSYYGSNHIDDDLGLLGTDWMQESLQKIIESQKNGDQDQEVDVEAAVPASDRYVLRSDNEVPVEEIVQGLPELAQAVESSNSIEVAQREIALAEIAIFEATLAQPQISIELIERFLRFCQNSLVTWIGSAATQFVIGKLTELIDAFANSMASG